MIIINNLTKKKKIKNLKNGKKSEPEPPFIHTLREGVKIKSLF